MRGFWNRSALHFCLAFTLALPFMAAAQQQNPAQQKPHYFNSPGIPKLEAPKLLYPDPEELYEPRSKVRLAWRPVANAGRYLVRIWDKNNLERSRIEGREPKPRWETAVDEPWIVLHDVPYTSFMYLESGMYMWEVGAIQNKSQELGVLSQSSFEVSNQFYLKKRELFLRLEYGFTPAFSYEFKNNIGNTTFSRTGSAHQLRGDAEFWFARHWGVDLNAQTSRFSTGQKDIYINRYMLSFLSRTYLSSDAIGTTLAWRLGLSLQDYPQISGTTDQESAILVSYPQAWGLTGGFRLSTRFSFPLELQFAGNVVFPFRSRGLQKEAAVQASLGMDASVRALIHVNSFFAYGIGALVDFTKLQYTRDELQAQTSSTLSLVSYTGQFLTQFHWD